MAVPAPIVQALGRYPGLDPQAVISVARQEGLSGGIGDNGHAFGPFQLNNAGGVLTGRFQGQTPGQINQWAWSPAGLDFALSRIQGVAGGQHGARAVESIVSQFERPANIPGEIAGALAAYGQGGGTSGGVASTAPGPSAAVAPVDTRAAFARALTSAISPTGQLDNPLGLIQALQTRRAGAGTTFPSSGGAAAGPNLGGHSGLASVDGIQVDPRISPELQAIVSRFGVTPTSGYRSPGHNAQVGGAENSDHLRGDAVDFAGTPAALAALYKYAQGRFPYVEPMAQAKNHVHISFARGG